MSDTLTLISDSISALNSVIIDTTFVIKDQPVAEEFNVAAWTLSNITELIVAALFLMKLVANLTPTEKDNKIFGVIDSIINYFIPDRKLKQ